MNRYLHNVLIWIIPAIVLVLSLIPMAYPVFFPLILQIIVTLGAAIITYLLFTEKPKNYLIWAIVFIVIILIYNPIIHLNVTMGFDVPLALITAIIFIANWWFVFRKSTTIN